MSTESYKTVHEALNGGEVFAVIKNALEKTGLSTDLKAVEGVFNSDENDYTYTYLLRLYGNMQYYYSWKRDEMNEHQVAHMDKIIEDMHNSILDQRLYE